MASDLESFGMDELLKIYDERIAEFSEGDIVSGRILQINAAETVVDIGFKSEGMLPTDELKDSSGELQYKVGDTLDVYLDRLENSTGYVALSREKATRKIVWDRIEAAFNSGEPVEGRVIDRVRGGMAVDVGVTAFLPGSLIDVKPVKNPDYLKGKDLTFKVISFDKRRNNVVLSRKAIVEVENDAKKRETFAHLEEGKTMHGVVKNITDYGAFVDLGGIDGLLHITDISWGRVNHPSEYFNVGDEIDVMVLKFDIEQERVSLGFKQKTTDPWLDVSVRYPLGSRVKGRVVSVVDYGAFIELEDGVEGLVHVSEMSWTRKVRNPAKVLNTGDSIDAVVSDVNITNRRISLSLKALEENPWDTIGARFPVGSTIEGRVRNLTDFGAFVEVEDGIDGLVHISDMSWSRRLRHPSEVLKKGDLVTARVINVDPDSQRLSLSIKEFMPNEWDTYAKGRQVDDVVEGEVSKITDFGLFISLTEGVEGLAHVSEIDRDPSAKLDKQYDLGTRVRARIVKIDWTDRKIGLSLRDISQYFPEPVEVVEAEPENAESEDPAIEDVVTEDPDAITETRDQAAVDSPTDAEPVTEPAAVELDVE